MPIETGRYCQHCVDERGQLQPFEERLERFIAFQQRRTPSATRAELEVEEQEAGAYLERLSSALQSEAHVTVEVRTRAVADVC